MAALLGAPFPQWFDNNGDPLAGGKVYTYIGGTSTGLVTYTDSTLAVANANPTILDANGRAEMWVPDGTLYKLILKDSTDVTIETVDNVAANGSGTTTTGSGSSSTTSTGIGVNLLDNGGLEIAGAPGRTAVTPGASAAVFADRWHGYRGGVTDYTVGSLGSSGLPNRITMARDSATSNTTSIVVGQHTGKPTDGLSVFNVVDRCINPSVSGVEIYPYLVFSCYLYKGADFSGESVELEIVTASSDVNIVTGSWTQEAVRTVAPAEMAEDEWTRFYCVKSGSWSNGTAAVLGVRIRFKNPSGTAGADDAIYITGCKLELAATAAPTQYVVPELSDSLRRCKRFYQLYGGGSSDTTAGILRQGYGEASDIDDVTHVFPVEMVKRPTAAKAGTWSVNNCAQPSVQAYSTRGFTVRTTVTGAGDFYYYSGSSDDLLTFDAET